MIIVLQDYLHALLFLTNSSLQEKFSFHPKETTYIPQTGAKTAYDNEISKQKY